MAAFHQAEKDEVLALEARQRRDSRERKQEDQHQHGFDGSAGIEAGDVVDFIADHVAMAQRGDHREGAQVHERVDQQVDEDAFDAVGLKLSFGRPRSSRAACSQRARWKSRPAGA